MTQAKPAPATVAKSAPAVVAKPAPIAVAKPAPAAVAKPASASVETTATPKAPVNTTSDAAPKTVSKTTTMAAASAASRPSINHRPPLLVISIVIAAFALATYYAYRQRTAVAPRDAAAGASVDTTKSPAAESSTGMIEKNASPPIVPAPAVTAADKGGSAVEKATAAQAVKVAPTMPNSAVAPPPANVLAAPVPRVQPAATSAENGVDAAKSGRRRPTQIIPDKPAAPTTPCTDAIAALGLCTPEPTQRRQ